MGRSRGQAPTTQNTTGKKMPTDNIPKERCTQANITKYLRKANTMTDNLQTPHHPHPKTREEISSVELEIIEQSEKTLKFIQLEIENHLKVLSKKKPNMF